MLALMDGVDFDDIRDYANKQLIIEGIKKPSTPEEKAMLEEHNKNKQPDAATLLAQAENKKGDADLLGEKRKGIEMQLKAQNDRAETQISEFEAKTGRMDTQIKAQEVGAKINTEKIKAFGEQLDNTEKIIDIKHLIKFGPKKEKKKNTG
jgi:hypothetical protein